jgi:hypothetical protein
MVTGRDGLYGARARWGTSITVNPQSSRGDTEGDSDGE